jgi:uncharacterized protein (TIGR03437 family)
VKTLFAIVLTLGLLAASAAAQPTVSGVFNSASYAFPPLQNSSIAQGSFFTIFGTGTAGKEIGPATAAVWTPWPLPTTLPASGGTSVNVTIGSSAVVQAYIYYTSANQINAVLPSTTPIGTGTISVTFNGQTGPTFPITVAATSFGVFADNASGTGPGTIMDASYNLLSPFHTVKPGVDYGILWGTGLGTAAFSNVSAEATALPVGVNLCPGAACPVVWVGGFQASVAYAGRSGFTGLDQINFIVPPGVQGCYVQVAVQTGGATPVISNFTSMAVDPNRGTCSDEDGINYNDIATKVQGGAGQANIGGILMLSNYLTLSGVPLVGTVQWDNDEISATFGAFPASTLQSYQGFALAPSVGNCTVTPFQGVPLPPPADPALYSLTALDAGAVSVKGPNNTQSVPTNQGYDLVGGYSLCQLVVSFGLVSSGCPASTDNGTPFFLSPSPAFADSQFTYTATGAGGSVVGAISAPITVSQAAASFSWTNQSSVTATPIDRTTPLTITWSGGDPNGFVDITAVSSTLQTGVPTKTTPPGVLAECIAAVGQGSFTIPAYVLESLPSTVNSKAFVPPGELLVGPASGACSSVSGGPASTCPAMTTPSGLDALYIVYHIIQGVNVGWQ